MKFLHLIILSLFAAVALSAVVTFPDKRIVNGSLAKPKQFPFQAGILIVKNNSEVWCGGSLVSSIFVLTAGHCLKNASRATVFLGANNIDNHNETGQLRINVNADSFIVHERYNEATLDNDIGLIRLTVPVSFNEYISSIRLPKITGPHCTYAGKSATISGWGLTSSTANNITNILHSAAVSVITNAKCNKFYLGNIGDDNLCSDSLKQKSACSGDSGGPLTISENGANVQIGIASFGLSNCCDVEGPAGYTRITYFLGWINETTGINYK